VEESQRTDEQKEDLRKRLRERFEKKVWPAIAKDDPTTKALDELRKQMAKYKAEEVARVMVMRDDKPRETFLLDRGSYETPKDKVSFATPDFCRRCPRARRRTGSALRSGSSRPSIRSPPACR
jgi:hypothetical protein